VKKTDPQNKAIMLDRLSIKPNGFYRAWSAASRGRFLRRSADDGRRRVAATRGRSSASRGTTENHTTPTGGEGVFRAHFAHPSLSASPNRNTRPSPNTFSPAPASHKSRSARSTLQRVLISPSTTLRRPYCDRLRLRPRTSLATNSYSYSAQRHSYSYSAQRHSYSYSVQRHSYSKKSGGTGHDPQPSLGRFSLSRSKTMLVRGERV
jgi:hypothetical protein